MTNKPKAQGTWWETFIVDWANQHPRIKAAWRLPEGGGKDGGDVAIETIDGDVYVIEAKWRDGFQIHRGLNKHLSKMEKADYPFVPAGAALMWKRSVRKPGNEKRSPDGLPDVVVIPRDEWLDLITR
jgi:hypothetical protein